MNCPACKNPIQYNSTECEWCGNSVLSSNSGPNCKTCNGTGQVNRVAKTFLGKMQTVSNCPNCGGNGKPLTNRPAGANE